MRLSSWSIKLTGTRIHRHGSPTLFLFSRDRIHRTDRRLLRRRPLPILLRGVAALLASARHLARLPADLLLLARLRHFVQLGHRLLYSVLQLHVQFTTSRKRNGANEKIVGLVVRMNRYERTNRINFKLSKQQSRGTSRMRYAATRHYFADWRWLKNRIETGASNRWIVKKKEKKKRKGGKGGGRPLIMRCWK